MQNCPSNAQPLAFNQFILGNDIQTLQSKLQISESSIS